MGDSDSRPQAAAAGHAAEGKRAAQRYARRAADERRAQRIFRRAVRDAREEGAHALCLQMGTCSLTHWLFPYGSFLLAKPRRMAVRRPLFLRKARLAPLRVSYARALLFCGEGRVSFHPQRTRSRPPSPALAATAGACPHICRFPPQRCLLDYNAWHSDLLHTSRP